MSAPWKRNITQPCPAPGMAAVHSLSPLELETLRSLGNGKTDREIAESLGLSEKTVHHHMRALLIKLCAKNRTHAVVQALRMRIIELDQEV